MKRTLGLALGLALCLASRGMTQFPPPPTPLPPTSPGVILPPIPPAGPPACPAPTTGRTLWDLLAGCQEQCHKNRQQCCRTQFGLLLNNMCKPITFATGGLVPSWCCDVPPPEEMARLMDPGNLGVSPAEVAAAKIKVDAAGAVGRRNAVRYLATADCHYYPEAEKGLVAALRSDRIECVRLEAAMALGNGCCCTKNTIEALSLTTYGGTSDGNPMETSERVRAAALQSLHLCLCRYCGVETGDAPPLPPELPPEFPPAPRRHEPPVFWPGQGVVQMPQMRPTEPNAPEHILEAARALASTVGTARDPFRAPTGQRGLFQIFDHARQPLLVKEEISYEESALFAPIHRPVRVLLEEEEEKLTRPSLGFLPGDR